MSILKPNKVYFDAASGLPLNNKISKSIFVMSKKILGNPSSIHSYGVFSKSILEKSRLNIANTINAHKDELIFTSSCSESISLAIMGAVYKAKKDGIILPHIITSTIEHSSVINACKILEERKDAEVTYLPPSSNTGIIKAEDVVNAIKENTVIVSIHLVNSEIGIIQPVEEYIKEINKIKEKRNNITKMRFSSKSFYPYIHIDAAQGYVHLDLTNFVKNGIDMISFNSVKIGGPVGVGVLYKKRDVKIQPIYGGGQQEFGLRPGTVPVSLVYGFSIAGNYIKKNMLINEKKYIKLKESFINGLDKISKEENFSFLENSSINSVPSIVSISFPYFSGQQFAIELDARNVIVSSKSACNNTDDIESTVVSEIRKLEEKNINKNWGTIRVSFNPNNKISDVNKLLKEIKNIIHTYKGVLY